MSHKTSAELQWLSKINKIKIVNIGINIVIQVVILIEKYHINIVQSPVMEL
jgi:hypothetical protein